jgi:prepilin-type N-terminal cleavage/methylation domain-containing protein
MNAGFAFIELLLVVALVTVVSTLALRGVANQHNAAMQNEAEVSSIMAQQASEWMLMELGDGGRVWVRKN